MFKFTAKYRALKVRRIGFCGGSDIRLRRTKLEMTGASIECVAAYEQQLRELGQYVINVSQHGVILTSARDVTRFG